MLVHLCLLLVQEMSISSFLISGNMRMVLYADQCYKMGIRRKILSFHFLLVHDMFSISGLFLRT